MVEVWDYDLLSSDDFIGRVRARAPRAHDRTLARGNTSNACAYPGHAAASFPWPRIKLHGNMHANAVLVGHDPYALCCVQIDVHAQVKIPMSDAVAHCKSDDARVTASISDTTVELSPTWRPVSYFELLGYMIMLRMHTAPQAMCTCRSRKKGACGHAKRELMTCTRSVAASSCTNG